MINFNEKNYMNFRFILNSLPVPQLGTTLYCKLAPQLGPLSLALIPQRAQ